MKSFWPLLLLLATAVLAANKQPFITRESLEKGPFQSIRAEEDRLLLQFKTRGARFYCMRNGREEKVNDYGETMSIKLGETFSLSEEHTRLKFSPLPRPLDQDGWLIEWGFDARSFGGKESTFYGVVLVLKTSAGVVLRFVEPEQPLDPKLPANDPTYQKILKEIAAADPLAKQDLTGETPTGEVRPTLPTTVKALHFHWEKKADSPEDQLEIRWIAVDVKNVEKDHVITTTKSGPGKTNGQFSLSAPTNGFPPGQYRVEIWQTGKMIYTEKFEVESQ